MMRWRGRNEPEDKDEKDEKSEEDSDVVHCPEHDEELPTKIRKEADQFEDP